jgi:D-alanyl-D-alanine dipeptidase
MKDICLIFAILLTANLHAGTVDELRKRPDLAEVPAGPAIAIEMRYATPNNFMKQVLYTDLDRVFLHREAYAKLTAAAQALQAAKPGYKFRIFDGLRPRSVQRKMWAKVKGTPDEKYVADPEKGSVHNFGMALDLTIQDAQGKELDMGTPYDSFQRLAQPRYEDEFVKAGKLSAAQMENRKLLRKLMEGAGFKNIPNEWWHFDARPQAEVRANYKIVE